MNRYRILLQIELPAHSCGVFYPLLSEIATQRLFYTLKAQQNFFLCPYRRKKLPQPFLSLRMLCTFGRSASASSSYI